MTATIRRRADQVALRWQARLDSEWSDRTLPWLCSAVLFVLLAALALAKARSIDASIDLSVYTQAAWLIREGEAPTSTLSAVGTNILSQQAAFLFYPMVAVTHVVPIVPALLLLQSAALALGVVPLWRVARRIAHLRVGATAALVFVYSAYPVLHNLNLDGFHPEVVALPGLLAAFYFAEVPTPLRIPWARWPLFAASCVVVVAARADLGLAIAGLGLLIAVDGRRRAGLVTAAAALAYTVVAALVIQPALGDGSYPHLAAFAQFGDSPGTVAWGMLTDPVGVLSRLLDEVNFQLLLTLLAPVLFLPLLAPRYLLPIVPLEALYFVADVSEPARFGAQTVAVTAFVFIASAFALARVGRMGISQVVVDRRLLAALVLAGSVFFVADAASSPYRHPWDWGGQDAADASRHAAVDVIPKDAAVRSTVSVVQLMAERPRIYVLEEADVTAAEVVDGVDFVVFDTEDTAEWSEVEAMLLEARVEALGFGVVYEDDAVLVLGRDGAPTLAPTG